MSKSRGNVVNPDDIIREYGADTMRLYEMFIGDFEKAAPWSQSSIRGCKRFLERIYGLMDTLKDGKTYSSRLEGAMHRTIRKVTGDIEAMKFNTAIAAMMSLLNELCDNGGANRAELSTLLVLLNPFAPHITEEMWELCGFGGMLNQHPWPKYDPEKCKEAQVEIVVQICGKVRGRAQVDADASQELMLETAKGLPEIAALLEGKTILKEIVVKGKLVNLVVK